MLRILVVALFVPLFFLKIFEVAPVATWSWWGVWSPVWAGTIIHVVVGVACELLDCHRRDRASRKR